VRPEGKTAGSCSTRSNALRALQGWWRHQPGSARTPLADESPARKAFLPLRLCEGACQLPVTDPHALAALLSVACGLRRSCGGRAAAPRSRQRPRVRGPARASSFGRVRWIRHRQLGTRPHTDVGGRKAFWAGSTSATGAAETRVGAHPAPARARSAFARVEQLPIGSPPGATHDRAARQVKSSASSISPKAAGAPPSRAPNVASCRPGREKADSPVSASAEQGSAPQPRFRWARAV